MALLWAEAVGLRRRPDSGEPPRRPNLHSEALSTDAVTLARRVPASKERGFLRRHRGRNIVSFRTGGGACDLRRSHQ
jgi:hypothetical protein